MPEPKAGEKLKQYIRRAVSVIHSEEPSQSIAYCVAKAAGIYRQWKKKGAPASKEG